MYSATVVSSFIVWELYISVITGSILLCRCIIANGRLLHTGSLSIKSVNLGCAASCSSFFARLFCLRPSLFLSLTQCCKAGLPSRRARCCIHKTTRLVCTFWPAGTSLLPGHPLQVTAARCQKCCRARLPSRRAKCCIDNVC